MKRAKHSRRWVFGLCLWMILLGPVVVAQPEGDAFADEFLRNHPEGTLRRYPDGNPERFLDPEAMPEAFFATCGELGLRIYRFLTERGVRVPQDVSLLIYDGPAEAYVRDFPPVDAVEFSIPQVIDLAEYYRFGN